MNDTPTNQIPDANGNNNWEIMLAHEHRALAILNDPGRTGPTSLKRAEVHVRMAAHYFNRHMYWLGKELR